MTPNAVVIELNGEIVAKGRPRFATRPGQRPIAYTPAKTKSYEDALRFAAHTAMDGRPLLTGPLLMRVTANLPIPASWSKKKQASALAGRVHPVKRPDLTNYVKSAEDALNCVVFADDSQIIECISRKQYGGKPSLKIIVTPYLAEGGKP